MLSWLLQSRFGCAFKSIVAFIVISFVGSGIGIYSSAHAEALPYLPVPGQLITTSPQFAPVVLKGIKVNPDNPFQLSFIIDEGTTAFTNEELQQEANILVRYFLAALTIPEKDIWVNLSPYEKNRIISNDLGATDMGRDLLAQDYILKQLSSSLTYPDSPLGKKYWSAVYDRAYKAFGTTKVPVETYHKIWIVPDKTKVMESGATALITESSMKVMLDEDYTASAANKAASVNDKDISSQVVRDVILPEINHDVNNGQNFAYLRQMHNAIVLAAWFKKKLKDTIYNRLYIDKQKIAGIDTNDPNAVNQVYGEYVDAFKTGAYNYAKKDLDANAHRIINRQYYSGGYTAVRIGDNMVVQPAQPQEMIAAVSAIADNPGEVKVSLGQAAQGESVQSQARAVDANPLNTPDSIKANLRARVERITKTTLTSKEVDALYQAYTKGGEAAETKEQYKARVQREWAQAYPNEAPITDNAELEAMWEAHNMPGGFIRMPDGRLLTLGTTQGNANKLRKVVYAILPASQRGDENARAAKIERARKMAAIGLIGKGLNITGILAAATVAALDAASTAQADNQPSNPVVTASALSGFSAGIATFTDPEGKGSAQGLKVTMPQPAMNQAMVRQLLQGGDAAVIATAKGISTSNPAAVSVVMGLLMKITTMNLNGVDIHVIVDAGTYDQAAASTSLAIYNKLLLLLGDTLGPADAFQTAASSAYAATGQFPWAALAVLNGVNNSGAPVTVTRVGGVASNVNSVLGGAKFNHTSSASSGSPADILFKKRGSNGGKVGFNDEEFDIPAADVPLFDATIDAIIASKDGRVTMPKVQPSTQKALEAAMRQKRGESTAQERAESMSAAAVKIASQGGIRVIVVNPPAYIPRAPRTNAPQQQPQQRPQQQAPKPSTPLPKAPVPIEAAMLAGLGLGSRDKRKGLLAIGITAAMLGLAGGSSSNKPSDLLTPGDINYHFTATSPDEAIIAIDSSTTMTAQEKADAKRAVNLLKLSGYVGEVAVTEEGLTWTVLPINGSATVRKDVTFYEYYRKLEIPQRKRIVPVKKTPPRKSAAGTAGMVMQVSLDSTTTTTTEQVVVNALDWDFLDQASPEVSGPVSLVRKAIQNAPFTGVWSGKEKVREEMLAELDAQAQANGWTPTTPVTVQSRAARDGSGIRTTVAMPSGVKPRVEAATQNGDNLNFTRAGLTARSGDRIGAPQAGSGDVKEAVTMARRIEAPHTVNVVWEGNDPGVSPALTAWRLAVNNFLGGTLTQEQLDALQAVHLMPGGWRQLTKAERKQYVAEKAARPDQDVVLIVKDINGNERPSTVRLMHNGVLGVTVGSPEHNAAKWDAAEKVVDTATTEKLMAAGLLGEDHTPPAKLSDEAALADLRVKVQAVLDAPGDSGANAELAGALAALQNVSPSSLQAEVLNLRLARDRAMMRPAGALAAPDDKANIQALGLLERIASSRGISTDFMANHTPVAGGAAGGKLINGGITEEGLTIETTSDGTQVPMFKNVPVDIKRFAGFNFQITSIGRNKTGAEIIMAKGI